MVNKNPSLRRGTLFPTQGFKKEIMDELIIKDFTFAWPQFLEAHPYEAINRNSMVYIFMVNGEPVGTVIRHLN